MPETFRAENCIFHQFPPEIIYTELLRHNIIQTLVVLGNVVDVAVIADGLEVAAGTFYLAFLRTPELRTLKVIALRLSHEIDVLDTSFLEGYCPVGIVLAHWRVDIEAIGQLCIVQLPRCKIPIGKRYEDRYSSAQIENIKR